MGGSFDAIACLFSQDAAIAFVLMVTRLRTALSLPRVGPAAANSRALCPIDSSPFS